MQDSCLSGSGFPWLRLWSIPARAADIKLTARIAGHPVEAGTQALPDHSTHGRFSTVSLRTTCYSPGVQSDSVMSDPEVM